MTEFEKRLQILMRESLDELAAAGIRPSEKIAVIRENRRAKKRLGCCKKVWMNGRIQFEIEVSAMLREAEDKKVKEVIIHELLHTCPGCFDHGAEWKRRARIINRAFGYQIERTARLPQDQQGREKEPVRRYRISCRSCGNTFYRERKSRVISHIRDYRCGRCGGMLRAEKIQNFTEQSPEKAK